MLEIKEYFCTNVHCKHYGLRGMGNLVKAGIYIRKFSGETKQMLKCKVCGHRFSETQSTIFSGCHHGEQTIRSIIPKFLKCFFDSKPTTDIAIQIQ